MNRILICIVLLMNSCTIEDVQDCLKITKIENKQSGYYLTLENNVIIYTKSSNYKIGEYYCFK